MRQMLYILPIVAAFSLAAVPVHAQPGPPRGGPPPQDVNVVNIPTVIVANSPTVTANLAVATKKIFDEVFTNGGTSKLIDVSGYRQIRVVARCTVGLCVAGSGAMDVTPIVVYGDDIDRDVVPLTEFIAGAGGASATYELPGQTLRIRVEPTFGSGGRVVVYARVN